MLTELPHFLVTRRNTATYRSVKAFNPAVDDWPTYAEILQHYFVNGVTDGGKKASILLILCETPTFKVLDNKLEGVSYNTLAALLDEHYRPTTSSKIVQWFFIPC